MADEENKQEEQVAEQQADGAPEAVADEPKTDEPEVVEEVAEKPAAAESAAAEEPPVEEPTAEEPSADKPAAEEPPVEEPAVEEPAAAAPPAASKAPAGKAKPTEDEGKPSPKQLRRQAKSKFTGEPRPQLSPEDRAKERAEARAKKSVSRRRWRTKARSKSKERRAGAQVAAPTEPTEHAGGNPKARQGVVISNKAAKTISVRVAQVRQHPVYKKTMRVSRTLHAHDENGEAQPGDVVRVVECRPLSRTKRWRLSEIIERNR